MWAAQFARHEPALLQSAARRFARRPYLPLSKAPVNLSYFTFQNQKKSCLPGTARDGRLFCASMHMEQVPITNIILHHQTFYFKTDCYALQHKYIHLTQLYLHFAKNDNIFATEKHLLASQKPYSMKKKLQPLRIYLSLPFNKSAP